MKMQRVLYAPSPWPLLYAKGISVLCVRQTVVPPVVFTAWMQ
jgi:hypothetical protein